MTRDDPSDFGTIRRTLGGRELRAMLDLCTANPYVHLFPMKPDIHTYPESATERELLQYKIAVEQAALDGRPIEITESGFDSWRPYSERLFVCLPLFRWGEFRYRVAKPKIAEGHNPAGVTEDQIPAGWRLFSLDEFKVVALDTGDVSDTRFWDGRDWSEIGRWSITTLDGTLITQKPAGFYLPKPKPVQPSPSVRPTTVLGWLNTLPAGYRERALKNRRPDDDDLGCSALWLAVLRLPWASSPEGTEFWSGVYDAVDRGDALPPLPDAPKKLVPWSLDNFVWPDCVRRRGGGKVFGVQLATEDGLYIGVHDSTCIGDHQPIDWKELAEDFEYSIDNGKTWAPCVREEVAL